MSDLDFETMYEGKYVLIRSYSSGVHVGVLKQFDSGNKQALLTESRRIHYWEGAFTLSKIATTGIKDGRISCIVSEMLICDVNEIIPMSEQATDQLKNFKEHG